MRSGGFRSRDEASWTVEEIPFDRLERHRIEEDSQLFYLLASASFIEITSDLYTRNLVRFFGDDDETVEWLEGRWEPEELQHGVALKRYVQAAWPHFDWDTTYRSFVAEFARTCSMDALEPTRALELAARCVVETGTSSFYKMLTEVGREPVLTLLAARICTDEIRHYKYFYRYFRKYCERERPGRLAVLRTLLRRVAAVHSEDALIAFKHLHAAQNPGTEFRRIHYASYRDGVRRIAKGHFPREMAVKMMVKPLEFGAVARRVVLPLATSLAGLVLG